MVSWLKSIMVSTSQNQGWSWCVPRLRSNQSNTFFRSTALFISCFRMSSVQCSGYCTQEHSYKVCYCCRTSSDTERLESASQGVHLYDLSFDCSNTKERERCKDTCKKKGMICKKRIDICHEIGKKRNNS